MPCESYKQALAAAAAAGEPPSRELAAHLSSCPACSAAFAQEQRLFAAIDSGLHAAANTEAPASLLAAVRVRIVEQPVRRSHWLPVAACLAAGLVLVLFLHHGIRRDLTVSNPAASPTAIVVPPLNPAMPRGPEQKVERLSPRTAHRRFPVIQPSAEAVVLIPEAQRRAFDSLLAGLQNGTVKPAVFEAGKQEQQPQEQSLPPLAITPMEIKPLASVSAESAFPNETSNH